MKRLRGIAIVLIGVTLCGVVLAQAAVPQNAGDEALEDTTKEDEALLVKMNLPIDGKGLLKYFRDRTYPEADAKLLAILIEELGSDDFLVREKAYKRIETFGTGALFSLRKSKDIEDTETRIRIHQLLKKIDDDANPQVQSAVARLLASRKPADACAVLLAYVPFAANEEVLEEMSAALQKLGVNDGKTDPALAGALKDKLPLKRRIAGEALAKRGAMDQMPNVRKLLKDSDALVRLRIGLALIRRKETEALPVLIDSLKELDPRELWTTEALLIRLAGNDSPQVSLGTNEQDRLTAWKAWKNWHNNQNAAALNAKLLKLELDDYRGFIQVVYQTQQRVVGGVVRPAGREVMEVGPNKDFSRPRWSFTLNTTYPIDVQVIGKNRLLLTEYTGRRVSVRDFNGRILQEKYVSTNAGIEYPIAAKRLRNGNTFVATRKEFREYDKNWKQIWSYAHYNRVRQYVYRANKLDDGTVVFIDVSGRMMYLNPQNNRIEKTISVGSVNAYYGGLDVLPNGNVLVPRYNNHLVSEYDRNGKLVWSKSVQWPSSAVRLPNGDTLVGSLNTRRLVQMNRRGQEIWSHQMPGQIYRVRVR